MLSKSKIVLWISLISFFLVNLTPTKSGIIINIILTLIILLVMIKGHLHKKINKKLFLDSNVITILSGIVSFILGIRFFYFWFPSSKLLKLCFNSSILKNSLLACTTFLLIIGCLVIVNLLFQMLVNHLPDEKTYELKSNEKLTTKIFVVLVITSIFCITICSKSSPIYPFNNWDDANCFFTVGKSITNNIVMYRDIFEQKGPLLYFIHTLAYLVSNTSFIGVYFLELIACFLFLLISYKTLYLFTDFKVIYTVPIFAVIIYSSSAFSHGGSAEEFCLPCIALCNYFGMKALLYNERISYKKWIVIGIMSGAVLWIKFSLLGFYIGFGLVFTILYIKKGWVKNLFQSLASLITGIVIVSSPILLYFIINDAVTDLFEVYFYDNLFIYTINSTGNKIINLIENIYIGYSSFIEHYLLGFMMIVAGIIYLLRKKQTLLIYSIFTFLFSFFFIYSGGRNYRYYSLPLSVFVPFGILLFISIFRAFTNKRTLEFTRKRYITISFGVVTYILCILFMLTFSSNTYMLKYSKEELPQYKFDKYISQTEHPTLLNYGFLDGGFYTVSNIMPNCKYFCGLNIPYDEIGKTQDYFIEKGLIDYVVTREKPLGDSQLMKYEYITTANFETTKNNYLTYYLYKKKI